VILSNKAAGSAKSDGRLRAGKSGGIRIIYYHIDQFNQIYMLFAYPKNEADDLSPDQIKQLRHLVQGYLK